MKWLFLIKRGLVLLLVLEMEVSAAAAGLALTIYNQNFGVVRDTVPLELKAGVNLVTFSDAAAFLEPSSVLLRDPAGKHELQILEQNFRGDPVSQETLLALNEGKTIQFEVTSMEAGHTTRETVSGRIIRSGFVPGYGQGMQPVIEVDGKLRFSLPGQPLFPSLSDGVILKPTLNWVIQSPESAKFEAELSYITGEMRWEADYNVVLPEQGNVLDLLGWVTIDNQCGRSFENARIKLMAGDVSKVVVPHRAYTGVGGGGGFGGGHPVTEKAFDEYHLYSLERPTALLDHQKKQVEFARASGVNSSMTYVYEGFEIAPEQAGEPDAILHTEPDYGTRSNKKVSVIRQFTNSMSNQLGIPLPKGRLRVYRRDADGQMEFTGEGLIDHTPRDETVRIKTGNAFDIIGERKRTDLQVNITGNAPGMAIDPTTGLPVPLPAVTAPKTEPPPSWIDESFEISLRNHKKETVEVLVREHLYRWVNWQIKQKSRDYRKAEAQTIEFPVQLKPDTEETVRYTVHYSW